MSVMAEERTPRMTAHARARCAEMGISTKVAKHIVRNPDILRPARTETGCKVAVCDDHPDYAVVFHPEDFVVVTVVFRTYVQYARNGQTFEVEEEVRVTRR